MGLSILLLAIGCEAAPPGGGGDGGVDGAMAPDVGAIASPMCEGLATNPPSFLCEPLSTDYTPGGADSWAPCVSDDGEYHRVQADISSIARVAAFEEIAAILFDAARDPTAAEFLEARLVYQRDQGLDSRVVRRYDPHFDVPVGTDCALVGVPDAYPEHCVGPARLAPAILDALAAGIGGGAGELPRVHAARIEASLLWFLYVSVVKESFSCTEAPKDCDSAYAYYTGGEPARGGIGLADRVAEADPTAHSRAWDGLLALRCWRDLDPAEVASDLVLRDLARAQLDRALLDGIASVVRARLVRACASEGGALLYHWSFARTLAPYFDRALRARDSAAADRFASELSQVNPGDADLTAAVAALDAFDCP